jgi:hypothetical protein
MATGNIATNDITGKYIKSAPPTAKFTANFDSAFKKKTLREWYQGEGIVDEVDGEEYDSIVGYSEFKTHLKTNK